MRILVLTKRQYMNKDLIDDRFGRFREIPLALARMGHQVTGLCLSYQEKDEGWINDGKVSWKSINAGYLKAAGLVRFIETARRHVKESDIIWACSDSFYGVIGCFLGRIYDVPVVFDIYDNFGEFFVARLPLAKQLYHWALRRSDAITCLSSPFAKFISDSYAPHQRIYPVEFAVRKDLFKPLDKIRCREMFDLPSNARVVGTAGALYKIREVELLLEAFEKLKKKILLYILRWQDPAIFRSPQTPVYMIVEYCPLRRCPTLLMHWMLPSSVMLMMILENTVFLKRRENLWLVIFL